VSGLCSIAPNRFAQQLGGPREWARLAKEGIYNLHHEIESLPLGAKNLRGQRAAAVAPDTMSGDLPIASPMVKKSNCWLCQRHQTAGPVNTVYENPIFLPIWKYRAVP
jgi:hypothetical protein